jgi:biopolymer transport protein TolQ
MAKILYAAFMRCDMFSQLVLLLLAVASVHSWTVMIGEALGLKRAGEAASTFLRNFQARQDPLFLFASGTAEETMSGPLWRVYSAGCRRLSGILGSSRRADGRTRIGPKEILDVEDAMALAISKESLQLESRLWVLGTIAAVSPLIGLFGTVWGIMVTFHGMAVLGTTSLRAVAPGLTTALITTAAGLAVAIPALVGHNVLSGRLRLEVSRMRAFAMDLLSSFEELGGAPKGDPASA